MKSIHEIFSVNVNWLLSGTGEKYELAEEGVVKARTVSYEPHRVIAGTTVYFGLIRMAGSRLTPDGMVVFSDNLEGFYAFRKDWLRKIASATENVILMRVGGDGMDDLISDGDTVMVDTGRLEIKNGHIYALGVDEAIILKVLELMPNGRVKIKSRNREYGDYEMALGEIRIIGQVIWSARQFIRFDL